MQMALSEGKLWVGDLDGPGLVALDARTGETVHSLKLPHEVVGIAVSKDGGTLVTAARDALEAYVVDAKKGVLRGSVVTGEVAAVRSGSLPAFFTGHPAFRGRREFVSAVVQDNVNGTLVWILVQSMSRATDPEVTNTVPSGPVHCIDGDVTIYEG